MFDCWPNIDNPYIITKWMVMRSHILEHQPTTSSNDPYRNTKWIPKEPQFETSTTIIENTIVDWNSNLQLGICEALSKSQHWRKSPWLQYNYLQHSKFDEPSTW